MVSNSQLKRKKKSVPFLQLHKNVTNTNIHSSFQILFLSLALFFQQSYGDKTLPIFHLPGKIVSTETFVHDEKVENVVIFVPVVKIEDSVLGKLPYLRSFKAIGHNGQERLTEITPGMFGRARALTEINLNNNQIRIIGEGSLDHLTELTHIYLADNLLTSLPDNIFPEESKIIHIGLANNKITAISNVRFPWALQHCDLSKNRIKNLQLAKFVSYGDLKTLVLNENGGTVKLPDPFHNPLSISIQELYFSSNEHITGHELMRRLKPFTHLRILLIDVMNTDLNVSEMSDKALHNWLPELKHIRIRICNDERYCSAATLTYSYWEDSI